VPESKKRVNFKNPMRGKWDPFVCIESLRGETWPLKNLSRN